MAIVGARRASPEGLKRARKLARLLVSRGIVVVSGLAEGIDTAAHRAAIEAGGHTIAVLGTGLDRVYPQSNRPLQDLIGKDHLLVTEFPEGQSTAKWHFPRRNRTMALLSDASVIIEAGDSSGSLSQGWEAIRLGRALFLARSVVEDSSLTWPEQMLGYGARVLADETLEDLFACIPDRVPESADAVPF